MDRIFCLSDTFDSNKKMLENLDIHPEDILSPNDPDAIDKIVAEIDKERDDLLECREKVKRSTMTAPSRVFIINFRFPPAPTPRCLDPLSRV